MNNKILRMWEVFAKHKVRGHFTKNVESKLNPLEKLETYNLKYKCACIVKFWGAGYLLKY